MADFRIWRTWSISIFDLWLKGLKYFRCDNYVVWGIYWWGHCWNIFKIPQCFLWLMPKASTLVCSLQYIARWQMVCLSPYEKLIPQGWLIHIKRILFGENYIKTDLTTPQKGSISSTCWWLIIHTYSLLDISSMLLISGNARKYSLHITFKAEVLNKSNWNICLP